jgi:hypothetical protein
MYDGALSALSSSGVRSKNSELPKGGLDTCCLHAFALVDFVLETAHLCP